MIPSAPMNMKGILAVGLLFAPYQFYGATSSRPIAHIFDGREQLTATPTPDAVVHGHVADV